MKIRISSRQRSLRKLVNDIDWHVGYLHDNLTRLNHHIADIDKYLWEQYTAAGGTGPENMKEWMKRNGGKHVN